MTAEEEAPAPEPACYKCGGGPVTMKGTTYRKYPGRKARFPVGVLFLCAHCPAKKTHNTRRVYWAAYVAPPAGEPKP